MGKEIFAAALLAASLLPLAAHSQEAEAPDGEQAEEREHAQCLRRAQAELEARQAEAARKLEGEMLRQQEMQRLQGIAAAAARRERFLQQEMYWNRRERDSLIGRDPTDLSSMARRGTLEHQMSQYQSELERTSPLRQGASSTLDSFRWR